MLKLLRPRPWVCSSCLNRVALQQPYPVGRRSIRWLSTAQSAASAASIPPVNPAPADHATSSAHDDTLLGKIFDCSSSWRDFSARSAKFPTENAGLFRNAYLTSPDGFLTFARSSLSKASGIVDRVLGASTIEEYKTIVRDLDRLSDLLCRVIDLSDFVRVTHPDVRIQRAASEAWYMVYQYMNQLNTMTGLNDQLGKAMENPDVTKTWSEEELAVAQLLKLDFMKSAVNLPQAARDRFVDLSQRISEIGSDFVTEMAPEQRRVVLPSSKFQGMDPQIARRFTKHGYMQLPTMSGEAAAALRTVHDEETRKAVYLAIRTASSRSVGLLEALLKHRAELADLAGFESYGHMTLRDRMMAKTPESINKFLVELSKNNAPRVLQEVDSLLQEKRTLLASPSATLNPWDREYYIQRIRNAQGKNVKHDNFFASYFSVGRVMQGLSRLFTRLYGIRFVPRETLPGEKWHPDVRRLDVVSDTDGHVAVLYCDLFYREDKSPNPAHFTIRCSRAISEDEISEAAASTSQGGPAFESPESAANDGMAASRGASGGPLKQLPTIALVCDFPQRDNPLSGSKSKPASLTFASLETLFHEMGHAIHSILARTSFQNVAGTRCATDLAELPSTLMEYFASDPSVLSLFARHAETDEPLDYDLLAERVRSRGRFEGCDTDYQIILAMLDQAYHSPLASSESFDTTRAYHDLQREHSPLGPDPSSTRWQGFFGHLFGYGSTYYSYLFDQVLAERAWKKVFLSGNNGAALSREAGEHLKESLLKWGGSREPWRCVSDVLRDERIAGGGEEAMALVGSWGTSNKSTMKH
ncbi:hypothetical protein PspLS_03835 [Pyricularia sp. CBS 133598]|nr:hypothetical protein PspLS_03835 [Pyricularia sp. CBS 133598]